MIAGRELDALVALKIFGIKKVHYHDWDEEHSMPQVIPSNKSWRTHQLDARDLPRFSSEMPAAWQVVEKMGLSGFTLCQEGIGWNAGFRLPGKGKAPYIDAEGQARADTAPLAICLAALEAVGAEVPA